MLVLRDLPARFCVVREQRNGKSERKPLCEVVWVVAEEVLYLNAFVVLPRE